MQQVQEHMQQAYSDRQPLEAGRQAAPQGQRELAESAGAWSHSCQSPLGLASPVRRLHTRRNGRQQGPPQYSLSYQLQGGSQG